MLRKFISTFLVAVLMLSLFCACQNAPTPSGTGDPLSEKPKPDLAKYGICYEYKAQPNVRVTDRVSAGDLIYFAVYGLKGFNRVLGYDTNTGEKVLDILTEDTSPHFLQVRGDELWVVCEQEEGIRVYDRTSGEQLRTVETVDRVQMFDFIGEQLFYLTHLGKIVRLDLNTGETKSVGANTLNTMMAVDPERKLIYQVDEPSITCYDAETMEVATSGEYSGRLLNGNNDRIFALDGKLYVAGIRADLTGEAPSFLTYGGKERIHYVDKHYVITNGGIYDTETGEKIINLDLHDWTSSAALTESGNLVVWEDSAFYVCKESPEKTFRYSIPEYKAPEEPTLENPFKKYTDRNELSLDHIPTHATKGDLCLYYLVNEDPKQVPMIVKLDTDGTIAAQAELPQTNVEDNGADILVLDNEVWVSVPYQQKILIFDSTGLSLKREIATPSRPGYLAVSGDWAFYSEYNSSSGVTRINTVTGEATVFAQGTRQPRILIDSAKDALYLLEDSTNGRIRRLSLSSLQPVAASEDSYPTGDVAFLIDGSIYWSTGCFDGETLEQIAEYKGKVTDATEQYVFTQTEIYDRKTGTKYETITPASTVKNHYQNGILISEDTLALHGGKVFWTRP